MNVFLTSVCLSTLPLACSLGEEDVVMNRCIKHAHFGNVQFLDGDFKDSLKKYQDAEMFYVAMQKKLPYLGFQIQVMKVVCEALVEGNDHLLQSGLQRIYSEYCKNEVKSE